MKLTLLQRRQIARETVPMGKLAPATNWSKILVLGHRKETYDEFNIPTKFEEVEEYYKTHRKLRINTYNKYL
jgi:hypothetical protein